MIASPSSDPRPSSTSLAFSTGSWIIPRAVSHSAKGSKNCQQEQKSFMRTVLKGRVNLFQGHSPENPLLTGTESYGTVIVLLVKAWVGNDLL